MTGAPGALWEGGEYADIHLKFVYIDIRVFGLYEVTLHSVHNTYVVVLHNMPLPYTVMGYTITVCTLTLRTHTHKYT